MHEERTVIAEKMPQSFANHSGSRQRDRVGGHDETTVATRCTRSHGPPLEDSDVSARLAREVGDREPYYSTSSNYNMLSAKVCFGHALSNHRF